MLHTQNTEFLILKSIKPLSQKPFLNPEILTNRCHSHIQFEVFKSGLGANHDIYCTDATSSGRFLHLLFVFVK